MTDKPFAIVFALYPGVTQLDFTGPHQVLSRLPGATVMLASRTGDPIVADGITFAGLRRLAEIEGCDMICVPGGAGRGGPPRALGNPPHPKSWRASGTGTPPPRTAAAPPSKSRRQGSPRVRTQLFPDPPARSADRGDRAWPGFARTIATYEARSAT